MENVVVHPQFWKGKTILLTGHTGFKGSWLSLWLQKLGSNLIGYSKSIPTKPSLFESANVQDGMISIMDDVCNYNNLKQVIKEYRPEIVIHMAAQAILLESYTNPLETFATNVMGSVNLLESIRNIGGVRVILNVTSDKCYAIKNSMEPYKENDPIGGYDPYSSSKGCAELITSSFRNSFFNPDVYENHGVALASARAGNVIGGGDWATNRLIPDLVRGVFNKKKIMIRHPTATRPWQYVLDPLHGYLLLVEKLWEHGRDFAEGWNFGPNDHESKTVLWIIEKLKSEMGVDINWEIKSDNIHEEEYLTLDSSKAYSRLGWKPKMDLESALMNTIEWYKHYKQQNDMQTVTEKQIDEFILK